MNSIKKRFSDLKEIYQEIGDGDEELFSQVKNEINELKKDIGREAYKVMLSGKFDKKGALLEISSGAGGRDAEDFVAMLLRMYERYAEKKYFKTKVVDISYGEAGGPEGRTGIKSVLLEVVGKYAFGFLKEEGGVHRLVRKSPFSSAGVRHTSFAQVDIFPIIDDNDTQVEIKDEDIRIDTFRSSGPGGQHVNRRESAVRINHLPTGIVTSSQSERLQGENKKKAMSFLKAKLEKLQEEKLEKEKEGLKKGSSEKSSWGAQVRNYVIHPYKMVKDLRTQIETSNVESVLDGNIDLLKDDFFQ